jgi:hypothetical protein
MYDTLYPRERAETIQAMRKIDTAFRIIVIRRSCQSMLFYEEDERIKDPVIVADRTESSEEVVA